MLCDILHLEGAEEIARYGSDFYAGTPAVTKNAFGKGCVYYVGTVLSEDGLAKVLDLACGGAGVASVIGEETELEVTRRISDAGAVYFVMNFKDQELPLPTVFAGKKDLLSGQTMEEGEMLGKYDVRIAVLQ